MGPRAEPERTCVGCKGRAPKRALLRFSRSAEGVVLDATWRAPGRGAYVHRRPACAEEALRKGALARALRVGLSPEEAARLKAVIEGELRTQ